MADSQPVRIRWWFIPLAILLAMFVGVGMLVAADVYYHHKLEQLAALNVWGYRGPTVGRKHPGEKRVLAVGGSTTFGYGVPPQDAYPEILEQLLNAASTRPASKITVINAGYNNEGAHSYLYTMQDYEYLKYDAVVIYTGYNDIGRNTQVYRHESPVFRLTGYMPILPTVIREKAMMLENGGGAGALEKAYLGDKVVFRPNLAQRATTSALDAATRVSNALSTELSHTMSDSTRLVGNGVGAECGPRWAQYCGDVARAVQFAVAHGKPVMIVGQPTLAPDHLDQQRHLAAFLQHHFGRDPRVRLVDLADAVNLGDRHLSYDGMHLTRAGNTVIARRLVGPVAEMIR